MNHLDIKDFIGQNISILDGVGNKTKKLLKKKGIDKISDLLWNFPQGYTDRSSIQSLDKLEIGKIATIKVKTVKYNFPRVRNLPNKVICEERKNKIDIVFFNSREGYIRKVLPLNNQLIISGKVNFFKKCFSCLVKIKKNHIVFIVFYQYYKCIRLCETLINQELIFKHCSLR